MSLWCTHQAHCLPSRADARDTDHQEACTLALGGPAQGSMGRWGPIRHSCRLYTDLRTDLPLRVNSVLRPQQHRGQDGEELQAHVWVRGGLETGPEGGNHMLQRFSHSRAWKTEEGCSRLLAGQASPVGRRQEQVCWESRPASHSAGALLPPTLLSQC